MSYEIWLGIRYLLAKRREKFVSVIAVLSIGGVALGVMALLLVLSVMSGFDYDLKEKLVGANSHLTIMSETGVRDADSVIRKIAGTEHVVGVSPFISGQAIIRLPERALGVAIRGIDVKREIRVSKLQEYMILGHLPRDKKEAVLGVELAQFIGVGIGDQVRLLSPADGKMYDFILSGIFRSGLYEYDAGLIGITLEKAQELFGLEGVVSGISVRLDNLDASPQIKKRLYSELGGEFQVKTWMEQNQTLFDALKLEKLVMFVILALIVLVAAVNIVSTLIMMVIEKTRDIGILKSIGASNRSVRWVFTWQGLVIGLAGTAVGVLLAWSIVWVQQTYHLVQLPSSVYYLDYLPVRIEKGDWTTTVVAAVIISLLATVYPARQAARLEPVEALRYE